MSAATATAGLSPRPAPPKERRARPTPERITEILTVLSILAAYGRHLIETVERRAAARGFATIAQFFGTVTIDTILAHIYRGLMRAMALERLLLRRAARGRDLRILAPRPPSRRKPPATGAPEAAPTDAPPPPAELTPDQADAAQEAAALEAEAWHARRVARSEPFTLHTLPSMDEIEAQVRRSPVGRTIAAICRDLGISPSLCDGIFWNRLFDAIRLYRGSLPSLVLEVTRRERRFDKEEWKHPGLELPEESRSGIRRVLGFFVGEPLVNPFAVLAAPGAMAAPTATAARGAMAAPMAPVAAAATGPP
jgi:hypothetical protein